MALFDTSVIILLPQLDDRSGLPLDAQISAITLAELSVGPLVARDPLKRAARQAELVAIEELFETVPFDSAAARAFAQISAELRTKGKKARARTFDALIAATAIANDLPLYTANPKDFEGIRNLTVIAVTADA